MKFLIIDKALPPNPNADTSNIVSMLSGTAKLFSEWVEAGKLEIWYHFADRVGGVGILNVESLDELNEMLFSHPASAITTSEIYPLVDPIPALERHIAVKK